MASTNRRIESFDAALHGAALGVTSVDLADSELADHHRPCAGGIMTGQLPDDANMSAHHRPCAGGSVTGQLPLAARFSVFAVDAL